MVLAAIQVSTAIVHRRPTFLSSRDWITVPWTGNETTKDILHRLLDIAVGVPEFLFQTDQFTMSLRTGDAVPVDLAALQSAIQAKATELDSRLRLWKIMCADNYPAGQPWEAVQSGGEASSAGAGSGGDGVDDDDFPIFRCRNISTMQIVTPTVFMYPDLLLAQSLCFYWAVRLVISAADSGVVSVVAPAERYELACNICRSMRFFVLRAPGCLASRMMFVLRVAFDSFADGMAEKHFIATLFIYIGERLRLATFSNKCADASAKPKPK